uniref:Uncharacterized protein n=1 Tax=Trypanosoma congolense (strain IL3000) TaxID=1068625 RepID=G0UJA9_TRYCI|nr:conserved hypothetical protein [Trypanosoma congolense IL3000]
MGHFTVYYGNNEVMSFNSDCSLGSLLSHMRELLMPPGESYQCFELLPLLFVLEQFKPPVKAVGGPAAVCAAQLYDPSADASAGAVWRTSFTGNIPFMGIPTRPVETRVDSFLGCSNTSAAQQTVPPSSSVSFAGLLNSAALASPQDSYVLLGCRCEPPPWQQADRSGQPNQRRGSSHNLAELAPASCRIPRDALKRLCPTDPAIQKQRAVSLQSAQIISTLPLHALGQANGITSPSTGCVATSNDTPLILAYQNDFLRGDTSNLPWRKAFGVYLSTVLELPCNESSTDLQPTALPPPTVAQPADDEAAGPIKTGKVLPSVASGLFATPVPAVTRYDVLWCGLRGEHIRLQDVLDDRLLTDNDSKRRRAKRA